MQQDNVRNARGLAMRRCAATALLLVAPLAFGQAPVMVKVPSFKPAVLQGSSGSSVVVQPQVGTSSRPLGGLLSAQACEAMKQSVIATSVPPNASVTAAMETVMFMTRTEIDMIDGGCATEPGVTRAQIVAARAERQQQYETAEQNCNAVQSGGRRCMPRAHSEQANQQPLAAGRAADEQRRREQRQQEVNLMTSLTQSSAQKGERLAAAAQEEVGQIVNKYREEDAVLADIIEKAKAAAQGNK